MSTTRPRTTRLVPTLAAALAGLWLCACGDPAPTVVDPPDAGPPGPPAPLAVLTGTVSVHEPPPADTEVRVALLWATNSKSWEDKSIKHFVAQDVAVTAVSWPAQFQLVITELPPESALDHGSAGGQVIAYRDLNHNGKLDFTPPDADHFVDEVVAYDSGLVVWYQDPEMNPGLIPGFSTSEGPIDTPITLTERPPVASCHLLEWELSDPVNGPAGVGPWGPNTGVGHMNYCPESPVQVTADGVGTELTDGDGSPPLETTELACQLFGDPSGQPAGFYEARWSPEQTSAFVLETCGALVRSCSSLRPSGDTPPSGWPCPCDSSKYLCTGDQ